MHNKLSKHLEGQFIGAGDLPIYYQAFLPAQEPRAILMVCHGLGDHSGRYGNLVRVLNSHDIAIYAHDYRGHGRSGGQRGHIQSWDELLSDLKMIHNQARVNHPDLPCFLFGHSLGGVLALDAALSNPSAYQGVIASAPALIQTAISPGKIHLSKILGRFFPNISMRSGLDPAGLSRDPQVVQDYRQDPLVHDRGTPRLAVESLAAQERVLANGHLLEIPLLLIHGQADPLIPLTASRLFFQQVTHPDKTLLEYPEGYHESHNDWHWEKAMKDLADWIVAHM